MIEVGIMYYSRRTTGIAWTAAYQELSFHHFEDECYIIENSDPDREFQESFRDGFPWFTSKAWEGMAVDPVHELPGEDRGVTYAA